jgi:hypothetical protein
MKVNVDVYTRDLEAAAEAFKHAVRSGATEVHLSSREDWDTKELQHLNLSFVADHKSEAISKLDGGLFVKDSDDLSDL